MNKSIVLFVLIAVFAAVSVQARRRLRFVETGRCPANTFSKGRWIFNEKCNTGSKLIYNEKCGKGFTYVEGKCRRTKPTPAGKTIYNEKCKSKPTKPVVPSTGLRGFVINEICKPTISGGKIIYNEKCKSKPIKPTKENFAEICPRQPAVRCPVARKCPVLLCKPKHRRPSFFTFRGLRCRGCDTCRTTKCENTKHVEERLKIIIKKYKRKHALLKQVYYWLHKLEKKLIIERTFFVKKIKRKHSTYSEWKSRVERLRKTYESLKKQHSEARSKVSKSHRNYKLIIKKLKIAKGRLSSLFRVYRKHVRTAERLYKSYLSSLKSSKYLRLQSELRLVRVMRSRLSLIETLVKKWIKIRTIHKNHYFLLERVIVKPLVGGKCLCPVVYRPVCGAGGITYSSECVARCSGAKVEHQGACNCTPRPGILEKIEDSKFQETKCKKEVSPGQFQEVACPEKQQTIAEDKKFDEVKCETRADGTKTCA